MNCLNTIIFNIFSGSWDIYRYVNNEELKAECSFYDISPSQKTYHESGGRILNDGMKTVFKQTYIYALQPNTINIYRAPSVLMHSLDFSNNKNILPAITSHTHICKQDQYFSTFEICTEQHFKISYSIFGSNKTISIFSHYYKKSV